MTDLNATAGTSRLTLVTRVDCGLCEDAERGLRRLGAAFVCLDVDGDPELQRRYDEHVPVLLLDGVELARAPLSQQTLRDAAGKAVGP